MNQFNSKQTGKSILIHLLASSEKVYTHHWQMGTLVNLIVATIQVQVDKTSLHTKEESSVWRMKPTNSLNIH